MVDRILLALWFANIVLDIVYISKYAVSGDFISIAINFILLVFSTTMFLFVYESMKRKERS